MPEGTRLYLLRRSCAAARASTRKEFSDLLRQGFQRVRVDGELHDLDAVPALDKKRKHEIEVVVDRVVTAPDLAQRLAECDRDGARPRGRAGIAENADGGERLTMSAKFACPVSGFTLPEIEPAPVLVQQPLWRLPACDGLGKKMLMDPELIVPDTASRWPGCGRAMVVDDDELVPADADLDLQALWRQPGYALGEAAGEGARGHPVRLGQRAGSNQLEDGLRRFETKKPFEGVVHNLQRRWRETESAWMREELSRYMSSTICEACGGYRLKPEALCVKIAGRHIGEVTQLSIREAVAVVRGAAGAAHGQAAGDRRPRVQGDPRAPGLPRQGRALLPDAGARQRHAVRRRKPAHPSRVADRLGPTGVLYVLDEPSIGLHQRDNDRLLETLRNPARSRQHGDRRRARRGRDPFRRPSDRHGAGGWCAWRGDHCRGHARRGDARARVADRPVPLRHPPRSRAGQAPQAENLRWLELDELAGPTICRRSTPTSRCDASSASPVCPARASRAWWLDTLYPVLSRRLIGARAIPGDHDALTGIEHVDKVVDIDQSPIGRTPRSNPATYTGAFTPIRDWFAGLPKAKARGYGPGRFSFNVKGGRCEACQGDGLIKIEMHFLPDVFVTCDVCPGQAVQPRDPGGDLPRQVDRGRARHDRRPGGRLLRGVPPVYNKLVALRQVGLGYIHIGQQATTLSGGEAQRVS